MTMDQPNVVVTLDSLVVEPDPETGIAELRPEVPVTELAGRVVDALGQAAAGVFAGKSTPPLGRSLHLG